MVKAVSPASPAISEVCVFHLITRSWSQWHAPAGIDGRTEATGLGVYYGVRELLNYEAKTKTFGFAKTKMEDQRVIVQGFGNGVCVCVCVYE